MKSAKVVFGSLAVAISVPNACHAQSIAKIEIYKALVQDVCGGIRYVDPGSCQVLTAARYDDLKRRGRLQLAYQTDVIPPDQRSFNDDLLGDSRRMRDFASGTSGFAALLVVTWSGRVPHSITVKREDIDGNAANGDGPYSRALGGGRFLYHFPYEQISSVVLTLESRIPNYRITYHP